MDHQAGQNDGISAAGQLGSTGAEALHIWRPRPLVRAIEWSAVGTPATNDMKAYEVFVMQDTLTELLKRVYSGGKGSELGFLVGDLCECPETGIRYVLMTSTIESRNRFNEDGAPQIPAEAYVAMQLKLDRRVGNLVGWYHIHHDADEVRLSANDIATHDKYFSEPWQSALVVAPTPDGPLGGFFRRVAGSLDGDVRRPFYEVLSARSFVARGVRHTCMNWRNYETEGDTLLIPYEGPDGTTEPRAQKPPVVEVEPPVVEDAPPVVEDPPMTDEDTDEIVGPDLALIEPEPIESYAPASEEPQAAGPAMDDQSALGYDEPLPLDDETDMFAADPLPLIDPAGTEDTPYVHDSAESHPADPQAAARDAAPVDDLNAADDLHATDDLASGVEIDPIEPETAAPESLPGGGLAADFADLQESVRDEAGWTPGPEAPHMPEEEDPLYSAGRSIDRLADRQGDIPDQRLAGMRAPYPATEAPDPVQKPDPMPSIANHPLAAAAGITLPTPKSAEADEISADAEIEVETTPVATPAPAKRKRRKRSRKSRKGSAVSRKQLAMAAVAVLVLGGGGFAALKLPALLGGGDPTTVRQPLEATEDPALAATGESATENDGAAAAGLGAIVPADERIAAAGGDLDAVDQAPAGDSAGAGELLADADPIDGPSTPPGTGAEDPASVADEVARLARPTPDRAFAAPVLAIDGTVVELNDERARQAAARRRAAEQATAESTTQAQLRTIRRPTVAAPTALGDDPGIGDVSIDRPELLEKLDGLSDDLSGALNAYFVDALALQNDEGSCEDVTRAYGRVDAAWKAYNGALGSPRVVAFEGARAARDVQLSERVEEVKASYAELDCNR